MRTLIKLTLETEGPQGAGVYGEFTPSGSNPKRVPVGIVVKGQAVLVLKHWEDDREHCDHCGGLFTVGASDDCDDRCGRCEKSHLECVACNRNDAEVCIECDTPYCSDCWEGATHSKLVVNERAWRTEMITHALVENPTIENRDRLHRSVPEQRCPGALAPKDNVLPLKP